MYFVDQKQHKTNDSWVNNTHVKATLNEAMHQYHAFLSTYGYGQDATVDYVSCEVGDENGMVIRNEVDNRMSINAEI